jgi:glutathione S-transferase
MMEQRKESLNAELINKQMGKVLSGLQTLNDDLGDNKWCVNNAFSLADIAVGCTLGYMYLRFPDQFDFANTYPNLHRLQRELLKRDSFKNSLPVAN